LAKYDLPPVVLAPKDHRDAQRDPTLIVTVTDFGHDSLDVEYISHI
jgi:hypothetical protein